MPAVETLYTLEPPIEVGTPTVKQIIDLYQKLDDEIRLECKPNFRPSLAPNARCLIVAHFVYGWPVQLITTVQGRALWNTNAFVPREIHDLIDEARKQNDLVTGAYPAEVM